MKNKLKKWYDILGCNELYLDSEIKKCYRELVLKYHPDKIKVSSEFLKKEYSKKFDEIVKAYQNIKKYRKLNPNKNHHFYQSTHKSGHTFYKQQKMYPKKHFIVFYNYYGESSSGSGHITFSVNAPFINRTNFTKHMEEKLKKKYDEDFNIIITNIIPLTTEEYNSWVD